MCAINGVLAVDRDRVLRMNEATKHRGPDGTDSFCNDHITLGHNRLAIIDTTRDAAQPMHTGDGSCTIVFNGEIYNYRELRHELSRRYKFRTNSDTEVLLAAYQAWGMDMLQKLRGMFAFALWDARTTTLYLVRDQLGIKPLYYDDSEGELVFSSELSGMIAGLSQSRLNRESVLLYLKLQYAPSPHSLVGTIQKLQPGQYLKVTARGEKTAVTYFRPHEGVGTGKDVGDVYGAVGTAVKRQLVSDRPLGIFLSGGIDSSVVLHHAASHRPGIKTFSVDFEMAKGSEGESAKFNTDAELAQKTAAHYGANHTTFTLPLEEVRENITQIFADSDEPVANPTSVALYLLSKKVREQGVVVSLTGSGGDELFGGYTRHRALMAAYYYQQLPAFLRNQLSRLGGRFVKLNTPFPEAIHLGIVAIKDKLTDCALAPTWRGVAPEVVERYFADLYNRVPYQGHPVHRFLLADRASWLPDESLAREDRMSMRHALELRVPLLDLDVVATADAIPMYKKTTPWLGKKILRQTYQPHLPAFLFNQPKRGFMSPGAKWMRDEGIKATLKEILSGSYYSGLNELFDWDAIQQMYDEHVEGDGYNLYPLWSIAQLQAWARKHQLSVER